MNKRMECHITGKVQRVMFRDFAWKKARALWLTGFVENLPDGSVHVVAEGEEEKLYKLLEALRKGPFNAQVTSVDVGWGETTDEFSDFTVVY